MAVVWKKIAYYTDELEIEEQEVVGRLTGGSLDGITIGIADNNMVQIDSASVADDEYARFTANGLESRSVAEVKQDLDLEIGTDVLAEQTIGIADDNLLEVDDAAAADNDFARFTANGIEGLTVAEAITALLGAALPENVAILLDPALSADEKYSGICETGTAGTTVDFGDLLYHDVGEGEWMLAKADVATTSGPVKLGINVTVAQAGNGDPITVLLYGKVRSDGDYDFTVDAPVYISAATAGDLTDTAPTGTTGFVVRIAGYGNTADELFFCPENDWITLA
jgi:hypothetical protein